MTRDSRVPETSTPGVKVVDPDGASEAPLARRRGRRHLAAPDRLRSLAPLPSLGVGAQQPARRGGGG